MKKLKQNIGNNPSASEKYKDWGKKPWHISTMDYFVAVKNVEELIFSKCKIKSHCDII